MLKEFKVCFTILAERQNTGRRTMGQSRTTIMSVPKTYFIKAKYKETALELAEREAVLDSYNSKATLHSIEEVSK